MYMGRKLAKNAGMYSLYVEAQSLSELSEGVPSFYTGNVAATQTLKTPYTQQDCVFYTYQIEREVEQRDSQGNVTANWQSMGSDKAGVQFTLQRGGDQVSVNPQAVDEVRGIQSQQSLLAPGILQGLNLSGITGALSIGMNSGGGQERISEEFIPPGMQLTVGGQVFIEAGVKTFRHDSEYPLVFTTKTKDALVNSDKTKSYIGYAIGVIGIIGCIPLLLVAKF